MSTKLVMVKATDPVGKALRAMVRRKMGSVIVVEKGKPVGILTERDISRRVAKTQSLRGLIVKKVMSRPLVTIGPSLDVWEAVEQMVRKDIRRLVVVDGDKLVGMVTEKDILRWVLTVAYAPQIPEDLKELLETRARTHRLAQ